VALVLVRQLWVIRLENCGALGPVVGADEVFLAGWLVVHIMNPTMPRWLNLLDCSWIGLASVSILNPPPLVFAEVSEVLIISIPETVRANKTGDLIRNAGLLVRRLIDLTSEYGTHEAFLAIELPELGAHHTNREVPRSHICLLCELIKLLKIVE